MTVVLIVLRHEAGGGWFESIAVDNYSGSEDPEAGRRWISKSKQTMSAVGMRTMSTTRFLEGKQVHRYKVESKRRRDPRQWIEDLSWENCERRSAGPLQSSVSTRQKAKSTRVSPCAPTIYSMGSSGGVNDSPRMISLMVYSYLDGIETSSSKNNILRAARKQVCVVHHL
jgi:hypothetical protein